jgi:hypothetical protein
MTDEFLETLSLVFNLNINLIFNKFDLEIFKKSFKNSKNKFSVNTLIFKKDNKNLI